MKVRFRMRRAAMGIIGACLVWSGLVGIPVLMAQSAYNSNVQGTVFDNRGAVVPGAKVALQNVNLGVIHNTTSNNSGMYRFTSVAPGSYQVKVQAKGFAASVTDVTVTADSTAGVDVTLQLATAITSITVTSRAAALNPDETRTQLTLSNAQLTDLPLQNGATMAIMQMVPGVTGITEWTDNLPIQGNSNSVTAVYSSGRPYSSNLYMLDGLPVMSMSRYGNVDLFPSLDMVQEMSVQPRTYSVENSATSSIQTDIISKSGTNTWHGDIDYRYQSKALAAIPDFTSALAPYRYDWITGSLGGAIRKDRTFVFGSFENKDVLSAVSSITQVVDPQFVAWGQQNYPNSINWSHTFGNPTLQPNAGSFLFKSVDQTAGDNGPCVAAGGSPTNPPTPPCGMPVDDNGYFNQSPFEKGTQFNVRLDQYFRNSKDRLYLNYVQSSQNSNAVAVIPAFTSYSPGITHYQSIGWTHLFSPTLLNQASFGAMRENDSFGGSPAADLLPDQVMLCCSPFMEEPTFFGPSANLDHTFSARDYVAWTHGRHNLQFGFQAAHLQYWQNRAGVFSRPFTLQYWGSGYGCCSGSMLAFMQDQEPKNVAYYTLSGSNGQWHGQYYGSQVSQFGLYAQDGWKVTPNLYLMLGLRWDDFGNPYNYGYGSGNYENMMLGNGSTLQQQIATTSYMKAVTNAFSGALDKNFEPRAGIAWSPKGHRTWSVRAGMGLYMDSLNLPQITANLPTDVPERLSVNMGLWNNFPVAPTPANFYGTSASAPPYGFNYPSIPITGTDSRGGVLYGPGKNYPAGIWGIMPGYSPSKTANYNFTVEHQLADDIVVSAAYVGSYSWNQSYTGGNLDAYVGELLPGGTGNAGLTSEWGYVDLVQGGMNANYNALLLTARQTRGRFNWQASYTQSRTLDDSIEDTLPDPYSPKAYYGASDIDFPQRLSFSGAYHLPDWGMRWYKGILGGWSLSAMTVAQDGGPFSVVCTSGGVSGSGACDYNANNIDYDYPSLVSGLKTRGFTRRQYEQGIFSLADFPAPAAFLAATPVAGEGNEPRNVFRNPGYWTVDSGLTKVITLPWIHGDTSTLRLTLEGYNILNRVNLQGVQNTTSSNNFGQVISAMQARTLELHARFEF